MATIHRKASTLKAVGAQGATAKASAQPNGKVRNVPMDSYAHTGGTVHKKAINKANVSKLSSKLSGKQGI